MPHVYRAPGDMTVVAWLAWFVITDPVTGNDSIIRFASDEGDRWEDLPKDGCLGLKLFHAAMTSDGRPYEVLLTGTWYYRAESNLGVIWNTTEDYDRDLRPGRYRNLCVKQGKTIPFEAFSPLHEEMTNAVR